MHTETSRLASYYSHRRRLVWDRHTRADHDGCMVTSRAIMLSRVAQDPGRAVSQDGNDGQHSAASAPSARCRSATLRCQRPCRTRSPCRSCVRRTRSRRTRDDDPVMHSRRATARCRRRHGRADVPRLRRLQRVEQRPFVVAPTGWDAHAHQRRRRAGPPARVDRSNRRWRDRWVCSERGQLKVLAQPVGARLQGLDNRRDPGVGKTLRRSLHAQ